MGAAATGVHNLLILTGDDPKAGDQPDAKAVFDLDSTRADRDGAGRCANAACCRPARKIAGGRPHFFIGAADVPIDPPPDWQPDELAAKVAAGAQLRADPVLHGCRRGAPLRRAARRTRAMRELALILIGITPLRSAKSARWMKQHLFGTIIPDAMIDAARAGRRPAAEGPAHLPSN